MGQIEKDYGETNFITGMRAFAAFGVMLIHFGGAGLDAFGQFGIHLVEFGRTGVYAFFVISGYSISASYQTSASYLRYLNRRLWRIAPIYYFWLAVAILSGFAPIMGNHGALTSIDARNVWMHLSFLSFMDYRVTNSILGVEWSISIEVFWYVLAPLLLFFIRGRFLVTVAVIVSIYWYWKFIEYPPYLPWLPTTWVEDKYDVGLAMHWSPLPYVASYCLGIGAFRLRQVMPEIQRHGNTVFVAVTLTCVGFLAYREAVLRLAYDEIVFSSLITATLIVFGSQSAVVYRWVFGNRLMVFLGTISYGVYLPQFLLLEVLKNYLPVNSPQIFFAACVLCTAVSYAGYRLIELPALKFGTSLGEKIGFRRRIKTS
jgi:peptidoglycan/LPS O-acetylase OafA/YrhL